MTQTDLEVLSGFAAVWERVSGERIEPLTDLITWEQVLEGLHGHWQGCRSLSVWAAGTHKKRLLRLAEEAKALFRRAQAAYYLETGDVFISVNGESFASYTPYNLRKLYKNTEKLAGLLQKAEEAPWLPMEDAWKTVSAHAEVVKTLLTACLQ